MNNDELIQKWLLYKEVNQGRSVATVDKYRNYLVRFATWLKDELNVSLIEARRDDVELFSGLISFKQGLTPRARRPLIAALREFYKYLKKNGLRSDDPAAGLEYPDYGRKIPKVSSLKTAERLLMAPDLSTFLGVRDCTIMSTLLGCGLRISGLTGLNESSLQYVENDGVIRLLIKVKEKGDKERLQPAPMEVKLLIDAYLSHPDLKKIDRVLPDGDRVLFVSVANRCVPEHKYIGEERRLSNRSVNDMISKYGEQLGIKAEELGPHALRHRFGTELAEGDESLDKIQDLLGHSDQASSKIYIHLATRKKIEVIDRSNPLGKIRTPVTDILKLLEKES